MAEVLDLEALLARVMETIARTTRLPEATYRLQFHTQFTFRDACRLLPYLRDLGITHCYASPYLKARPGSTHGYDIINHNLLNPEIGSEEDYAAFVAGLREHGLGQILDTVPNHMGVGNDNPWWQDVLENGPASPYASYFDVSWYASPRPELRGRVLIPILGDPYGKVLESGQLRLAFAEGAFTVYYFDHHFPVDPRTYETLLTAGAEELERTLPATDPAALEYHSILTAVRHLPLHSATEPAQVAERQREKEVIKRRLATLARESVPVQEAIEHTLTLFNGRPGDRHSFDLLDSLLDGQPYRLSFWRVASEEINYRRFFDINELAAVSMEREEVFRATHELVLRLLAEGQVDGLRIDHPDGLFDPKQYLRRLQQHYLLACARHTLATDPAFQGVDWATVEGPLLEWIAQHADVEPFRKPLYVVVEKILATGEPLPEDWPVYGTTGYGFLNKINGLFVDGANAEAFTRLYRELTEAEVRYPEVVYQKKFLILNVALASELQMLAYQLDRLAQKDRWSRDFTLYGLRYALRAVIACFPVYRSYISDEGVRELDRRFVELAVRRAMARNPTMSRAIFRFVRDTILLQSPESFSDADRAEQRRFAGKFQQVTAPVTAKGVEDTAFYNYNRLLSLNEVGGDPGRFGVAPESLHRYLQERQAKWPYSLAPLSTHDTKRSEDVRARLNVLSEVPEEWGAAVARWRRLNEPRRLLLDELSAPDPNEEYFLYQALIGAWPLEPYTADEYTTFVQRIQDYMTKALHEAKVHSSWINPDADYDNAIREFVARILDEQNAGPFLQDFRLFQRRISRLGLFNALAQTLLRLTAPGVPDTYQGTELWDFSLVDPDNRRPVDYERRRQLLRELQERTQAAGADRRELVRELTRTATDGRIKLFVTWQSLWCRRDQAGLFSAGDYLPVEVTGARAEHVFGFLRRQDDRWALVVVPRLFARLLPGENSLPLGPDVWQDTTLRLPPLDPSVRLRNRFTGEVLTLTEQQGQLTARAAEVFAHFPVALFASEH